MGRADALIEHPEVAEAAVIGVPGQVVESLEPTFRAQAIQFVPALPKTQSGKVVRRLIRRQYLGLELGDTSTVENPGSLESFRRTSFHS